MGLIRSTPNISPENLTNHLTGFPLKSRAINTKFLNRVQIQKVIIPEEATRTIQEFITRQLHIIDSTMQIVLSGWMSTC